jgi:hypothetical protein
VRLGQAVAFVVLAAGGVAALTWAGGGFLGEGLDAERPQVEATDAAGAPLSTGIALDELIGDSQRSIPGRMQDGKTGSVGARESVARSWTDGQTRIEFPRFLAWTFSAREIEPFRDPATGEQGFRYRGVRIAFYRDPETRAEAEALRDDPVGGRLLQLEVEADEGWAEFAAQVSRPEKPLVRLPGSARLRDHQRDLTVVCDDTTVDLDAGTAVGAGDLVAEHPAYSLRGCGMRIDGHGSRFEIVKNADVRIRDQGRRPGLGGEGSIRPSRVRAAGGVVLAPLAPAEGKGYRVVIERDVRVEQHGGPSLTADTAEVVVVPEPGREGAAATTYALRSFVADGRVSMSRPGDEPEAQPSSLSVFCDRLRHDPTVGPEGLTVLEGTCRATYRGAFSPSEGGTTRGLVRASCRRSMTIGPAGEGRPAGDLRLSLEGDAVVERTEAAGAEAPERLEAPRIELFLRKTDPRATTSAADPGSFAAVAFTADGGVRIDGPRLSGTASTLVGLDLDRPDFRLRAEGPDASFEVADLGHDPRRTARRPRGVASDAPAPASPGATDARRRFDLVALRAEGDVHATLLASGSGPLRLEGRSLDYDRATGAVLLGAGASDAWMALDAGEGRETRVAAPKIVFDAAQGVLTTDGETDAVVWLGAGGSTRAKAVETDRVRVRGEARIAISGGRAEGAPIVVAIEGGGSIETVGAGAVAERLRAERIELRVGETTGPPASLFPSAALARPARDATPASAGTPSPASSAPTRAERWNVRSRGMAVRLASFGGGFDALRSFEARGGVVAKTDAHAVEGESLSYDGASKIATVVAPPGEPASLRLGQGEETQRAWAHEIRVTLEDGRPVRALLVRPATVVLFRETADGGVERLRLRTEGDLEVGAATAKTVGRTAVSRSERAKGGADWSEPATLWTPDLTVEAPGLLGGGKVQVRRLVARGAGTRFETGAPEASGVAAIGDSIVYDAVAGTVTVRDSARALFLQKERRIEARSLVYDLKTGLPDFEGPRMVLGGP